MNSEPGDRSSSEIAAFSDAELYAELDRRNSERSVAFVEKLKREASYYCDDCGGPDGQTRVSDL